MIKLDKPRLRNVYRKLQTVEAQIEDDFDPVETGQEMLDLLAVMAGIKPVFLHGRGLFDPAWMEGVVEVAGGAGLRVIQGTCWNPLPPGESVPAWYAECVEAEFAPHRPFYICRSLAVAEAVQAASDAGGRLPIAEEARLLGYPECCVAAHHARAAAFHTYRIARIAELAGADEAAMRALYEDDFDIAPRDDGEAAQLALAMDVVQMPYTSWNLCVACRDDLESPSVYKAMPYIELAESVDMALHDLLLPREDED